jgi:hypothetical protein
MTPNAAKDLRTEYLKQRPSSGKPRPSSGKR